MGSCPDTDIDPILLTVRVPNDSHYVSLENLVSDPLVIP